MSAISERRLAHYRIVEKLGQGGMGEVWRAIDTRLDREVAIKFLPDSFQEDPYQLARLEREAKAVAALNHPNIVTVFSVEKCEDQHFFTMELVRGKTLADLIPEEGFPLDQFFDLAIPMTDAISSAHQGGITHRDLKPQNIMVSAEGRVKVMDFGLARLAPPNAGPEASEAVTRTLRKQGRIAGTLAYMSPEQIREQSMDQRSDIFSLGIVLYEMATGRRPFTGEMWADLMAAILKDTPPLVTSLRPGLPHHLGRIIKHCLEKDPCQRMQTTLDLRNQLQDLEKEEASPRDLEATSIAVLPFTDMSQDKDQAYFCEGVAEEIINALTKVRELRVAARGSSFLYGDASLEIREIGRRLQVGTLLGGSVRKAGDQLRITVELTDVENGYHLWSERFDGDVRDIFSIQDEIARKVAESLRVSLTPDEQVALGKASTTDLQAYDCYLRGRQFYDQYHRKGIEVALKLFSRAIKLDPHYAPAYAGIADCCSFLFMHAGADPKYCRQADEASRKALELDPDLAQVHTSRGLAVSLTGDHEKAAEAFEGAIARNPSLFEAYYFYARDSFAHGKFEKAVQLYEKAIEVRPDDYQSPLLMAQIYEDLGRGEDAEKSRRRGLASLEKYLALNPRDARALYLGANALVALGEKKKGLEWARRAEEMDPEEPMLLYNVGCIRSLAGQVEEAIDCLEEAIRLGLTQREWFERDNNLDPLRKHARFQALMRQIP